MTGIAVGVAALMGVALGWWGAAVVALLALLAAMARSNRAPLAACVIVVIVAGLGAWRADRSHPPHSPIDVSHDVGSAVVVTAPIQTGTRQHFVVASQPARALDSTTRICVTSGAAPIVRIGDTVLVNGSRELATDQAAAVRAALAARDCATTMLAQSVHVLDSSPGPSRSLGELRVRLGAVLRGAAPGDTGVLLAGLVTGEDDGFSPERQDAFIRTGTTHLTAVSGSNLALVVGMLATVGAVTIGRHRAPWQAATIVAVWGYALVSGSHPPSLRAAIVATAAICAFRVGRRPDFPTLILLAAGAMVILEPRQIGSLGFLLSVAASLALAMVVSGLLTPDRTSWLAVVLTATVAAQLATLPFLLPVFGTVSLTSVPANIIAAPLIAAAMPLAVLAGVAGLLWLPLGEAIAAPAALVASVLIDAVDVLAASGGYISVGVPPQAASAAIAVTAVALIVVVGRYGRPGSARQTLERAMAFTIPGEETAPPATHRDEDPTGRRPAAARTPAVVGVILPSPTARIVAREDPFDAFAAHLHDSEQKPAGKEIGHEVTDIRQGGKTVTGQIVRHLPGAHPGGQPEHDHKD
jgi:competence protein ComEC